MTDQHTHGAVATLEHYRPTADAFDDEWGPAQRNATLAEILGQSVTAQPPTRWIGRHRRWVAVGSLAACAVAAGLVAGVALPAGSPGGPGTAAAATLERLAATAGQAGGTVGTGQFAYVRQDSEQTAQRGYPIPPGQTRTGGFDRQSSRSWTAPSGDLWAYRALGSPTACLTKYAYRPETPLEARDYEDLSAADLAALPTDADRLAAYLNAHPSGDNRGANNAFTAIGDLVRSGLAAPALRAAAIRALARTRGISVHVGTRDTAGRPAIRVDNASRYGVESLFFDPSTSRLLEEQVSQGSWLYRSIIRQSGIVDSIPAGLPRCPASTRQPH